MLKKTGKILRVGYNLLAMGLNKLLLRVHQNDFDGRNGHKIHQL